MMRQQNWLCVLHVRVTGQTRRWSGCIGFLCASFKCVDELQHIVCNNSNFPLAPQPNRRSHLIITTTSSMDSSARFTSNLGHSTLNGCVNIFISWFKDEFSVSEFITNGIERSRDRITIIFRHDAD